MYIYIITFTLSCILIGLSELQKNKIIKKSLIIIGILIPCLLAGFRADIIGTDVNVYVKPIFEAALKTNNLNDFFNEKWYVIWRYEYVSNYEIGFTLLVYVITKIFASLSFVLFIIQVLIIVPIYKALEYFRDKLPIWFGLLIFYLLFFNASLNMMRQWIAMSFLLYSIKYLVRNEKIKYFIIVFCAMIFHTSSLLGFLIYVIYVFLMKKSNKNIMIKHQLKGIRVSSSIYKLGIVTCLGIIMIGGLNFIVQFIKMIGLDQYIGYISGNIYIVPNQIISRLPIIIIFILNYRYISKIEKNTPFWLTMLIIDLLTSQLVSISAYSFRLSVYFSEYSILSIPIMLKAIPNKTGRKGIIFIILIIYLFYYWWFYFVFNGMHETIPYISMVI